MMRILVVVNDTADYGSQRVARLTARALLDRADVDVAGVVSVERPASSSFDGLDVTYLSRRYGGPLGLIETIWKMRGVLRVSEPSHVISHMTYSNIVCMLAVASRVRRTRPVVVVTEHGVADAVLQEKNYRFMQICIRFLYPWAARLICVSDFAARSFLERYPLNPEIVRTVYNPRDERLLDSLRSDPGAAPHAWLSAKEKGRTILCVAGFRPAKGHDVLISALVHEPDLRVVFVGDGPLEDSVKKLAAELGVLHRCSFEGRSRESERYIAHAAVLAIPSRWESFGLVAIEAAALGVPVVASSVGGLAEIIPSLVPGRLVPSGDARALGRALSEVLDDPPEAVESARVSFDPVDVADRYLRAFPV